MKKSWIALAVLITLSTLLVSCKKTNTKPIEVETIVATTDIDKEDIIIRKIGDYTLDEDGNLTISNRVSINPLKVSDGNIKYTIIYDDEMTEVYTYHTAHESIDDMVDFLYYKFNKDYKGNIKPFEYK
tara:strand:+ start:226417 stop:226800 length:384 start_codon:yes stop_codon:yes gene_type:complete